MQRVKMLRLRSGLTVMLGVMLTPSEVADFGITLSLMARSPEQPLPAELMLSVWDDRGKAFIELEVGTEAFAAGDAVYQFQTQQFSGQSGEPFQVRVCYGESIWIETFVI
jgi:hypothetical protein